MNRLRIYFAAIVLGMILPAAHSNAADSVWIEGESATSNVKPNIAGWGLKSILSGERWLHYSVDADKIEKDVPADGATFSYSFTTENDDQYEAWDRVGFEFARSPFRWRIDGGEWAASKPDDLTTDLMELDFFCEVAWLKLGTCKLAKGGHTLEINLQKTKDAQGKFERILYASDVVCITPEPFRPNGRFKPGDDGRDDRDKSAGKTVFQLPEPKGAERSSVALKGLWEIGREDEQLPGEVAAPMAPLPQQVFWRGIDVPGDKNTSRPDLVFAHRLWYRTRIDVPKSAEGRSFFLAFPAEQSQYDRLCERTVMRFRQESVRAFAIQCHQCDQAGRE